MKENVFYRKLISWRAIEDFHIWRCKGFASESRLDQKKLRLGRNVGPQHIL